MQALQTPPPHCFEGPDMGLLSYVCLNCRDTGLAKSSANVCTLRGQGKAPYGRGVP